MAQEKSSPPASSGSQTVYKIALWGLGLSFLLGILTNMINGWVSPEYFRVVMRWDFDHIWSASVIQGALEGLIWGLLIVIGFSVAFHRITAGEGSFHFARRYLLRLVLISAAAWVLTGALALAISALNPHYFHALIRLAPPSGPEQMRFAWVGGSITGVVWGGLVGAVFTLMAMGRDWKKGNR